MKQWINGVAVEMTPEEVAAWEAEQAAYTPPEQQLPPVSLQQVAGARLMVGKDTWDVTGIERSTGISAAWLDDTDKVLVFFTEPQPDDTYEVVPSAGVTKFPEYVEVTRPGLTEIVFIVQRVQ